MKQISRKRLSKSRRWQLKKFYGLTEEWYFSKLEKVNHKCEICGGNTKLALVVDHNHLTGNVRGLLCSLCNAMLPIIEDPDWREAAIEYLDKYDNQSLSDGVPRGVRI